MKKTLLALFALCMLGLTLPQTAQAQCMVDSTITSPGIYPDTLAPGCIDTPYTAVVQFAFPSDTVIFGQTLQFDSFVVTAVNNVPAGLNWQCDQFQNNCTYYTTPGQLTRGCVEIMGTPTTANNPQDSVEVIGQGWVTIPFVGPYAAQDTIRMGLLVEDCTTTSAQPSMEDRLNVQVSPNPVNSSSRISYTLPEAANVRITVFDIYGKVVAEVCSGNQGTGYHAFSLEEIAQLAGGTYLVKMTLNNGEFSLVKKVMNLN